MHVLQDSEGDISRCDSLDMTSYASMAHLRMVLSYFFVFLILLSIYGIIGYAHDCLFYVCTHWPGRPSL